MQNEYYKPIILENIKVSGIADGTIPPGEYDKIIVKKFTSSVEEKFARHYNNIISLFLNENFGDQLNRLLVIIKPDFKAYVYKNFPFCINIKASRDLKKGEVIRLGDFADVNYISFHDAAIDLNPKLGDQIVWLFRYNWHFGLYFDFSRQSKPNDILCDMGYQYKRVLYLDMFNFLSEEKYLKKLIDDGWFPFIRLLNGEFDNLISYYEEESKFGSYIQKIIDHFTDDYIKKIIRSWWENPILKDKRYIIESGIEAYMTRKKSGFINCIKNLMTELEGIIRMAYFYEKGIKNPSTKQIKEYIVNSGENNFNTLSSLGFTKEFMFYLNDLIFKEFDLDHKIQSSRHAVAHGVLPIDKYTQVRALQIILTIDQVFYFLGNKTLPNKGS